jgi:hypothetical protein
MADTPPVRRWSGRRKLVIAGLTLSLLLVLAAVGGAVWWRAQQARVAGALLDFGSAMQNATAEITRGVADGGTVSMDFLGDLKAQRWHEAYQRTSRAFQVKVNEAAFEQSLKDAPALNSPYTSISFNVLMTTGGGSITFNGTGQVPKGGMWLLLTGEDGTLKIDRLSVDDKSLP